MESGRGSGPGLGSHWIMTFFKNMLNKQMDMSYSFRAEDWVLGWKCRFGSCWYKEKILNYGTEWDFPEIVYEIWQKFWRWKCTKQHFFVVSKRSLDNESRDIVFRKNSFRKWLLKWMTLLIPKKRDNYPWRSTTLIDTHNFIILNHCFHGQFEKLSDI